MVVPRMQLLTRPYSPVKKVAAADKQKQKAVPKKALAKKKVDIDDEIRELEKSIQKDNKETKRLTNKILKIMKEKENRP